MNHEKYLPASLLDQPFSRIVTQGEIIEFRFADGSLVKRSAQDIREFLKETEEVNISFFPTRVEPQMSVGDVISWNNVNENEKEKLYGRLIRKDGTKNKGSFVVVEPITEENQSQGFEVEIRYSQICSIMSGEAWSKWKGITKKPKGFRIIEESEDDHLNVKRRTWAVLLSRTPTGRQRYKGSFERIYTNLISRKEAEKIREELQKFGVDDDRISIIINEQEINFINKFGKMLHETITGQAVLWFLRLFHYRYRRRRCNNSSGNPKIVYENKDEAIQATQSMQNNNPKNRRVIYHCRKHHGYHIGNQ